MMELSRRIQLIERVLFGVLLVGCGGAGALYELYNDEIRAAVLLPLLIAYLFVCYGVYLLLLRLALEKIGR